MIYLRKPAFRSETDLAVALTYEGGMQVPLVSAIGQREFARQIRSLALRYGIQIENSPELASLLSGLDSDQEIPPEHYQEVAELFIRRGLI